MNQFDVFLLAYVFHSLTVLEQLLLVRKLSGGGAQTIDQESRDRAAKCFETAVVLFRHSGFPECLRIVQGAQGRWEKAFVDVSQANEILHTVQENLIAQFQSRKFLSVSKERSDFMDAPFLFGVDVNNAFPSAVDDVREAGNCLAAKCNTASVFHLMRAAEVALRALATDRQVTFANKPFDLQQWGTILGALEGILKEMRLTDGKKWKDARFKESQIRFYNDAVQELRGFNEAWRRYLSHARADAFCDRDYAASVMNHVRAFMQKVATRISEGKTTLEYWDTE